MHFSDDGGAQRGDAVALSAAEGVAVHVDGQGAPEPAQPHHSHAEEQIVELSDVS